MDTIAHRTSAVLLGSLMLLSSLLALPVAAWAVPVSVKIGGTTINGTDELMVTDFLAVATGYRITKMTIVAVDTPAFARVSLTGFEMIRPIGAAGGSLEILFESVAEKPKSPVRAQDPLFGIIDNSKPPDHTLGMGDVVIYQGLVNNQEIGRPAITVAPGGTFNPFPLESDNEVVTVRGGPPWMLKGVLSLTLGLTEGDRIRIVGGAGLVTGATVSIAPVELPASLILVASGALVLSAYVWRLRSRAGCSVSTES